MDSSPPIYVTKPHLPPLDDFIPLLQEIWERRVLTNNGPFHQELEEALCEYLGVKYISLFSNGTIALVTALKAIGVSGEVITTPYSFVATAHSLLWNNLTPVFVDIDPVTFNLDPSRIEAAITEKTTAILPVHCYGIPCDIDAIEQIANKHDLRVIYDAAHAFGVECHCGSILNHGDLSVLSFHATKVFNTFEGGAIICHDRETKTNIDRLKNFGFASEINVESVGINGKMNELQAALGLLQLKTVDSALSKRSDIDTYYRSKIKKIKGITCPPIQKVLQHNYSYFPVLIDPEFPLSRDEVYQKLKNNNIFARRYFYPLIVDFAPYKYMISSTSRALPVANKVANQVLCLPIYPALSVEEQDRIISLLEGT